MGKAKKKQPITQRSNKEGVGFKHSRAETAKLIRHFHQLNKQLSQCKSNGSQLMGKAALLNREKEQSIREEMDKLGGLDWYQKASQLGQSKTRGGDSSKWLIQTLRSSYCATDMEEATKPLRILEVGAVAPDNYQQYAKWIKVDPIDLNPQHASIKKQDFLTMVPPSSQDLKYDIISLSLVVNFVGDSEDRGKMLLHTRHFLSSVSNQNRLHYLFIVLPLPCIDNSRYMTHDHFTSMMISIGYQPIHYHFSNKLAYFLYKLRADPPLDYKKPTTLTWKKKILPGKDGGGRNNFCITIGNNNNNK
ncbi:putative methyltransferase-domain-containing protein [Absidia repens]|uniref:25S rRNA adenine-N(1) methyltransferase n=1 Tax=Absidia repens TaxID=90262 RepID=A0A1X2HX19_9FUNG|nr:putative methyltransferase-domain-containing protein [Absidia repens]